MASSDQLKDSPLWDRENKAWDYLVWQNINKNKGYNYNNRPYALIMLYCIRSI